MNDSIQRFQGLLAQNPANDLARFSLAKAFYDSNQFDAAKAEFARCLDSKPQWMMAQILLGKCELALGNRSSAKSALQKGLQLAIEQHHDGPQAELEGMLADLE